MQTNIEILLDLVEQRYDKELAEKARAELKQYKAIKKAAEEMASVIGQIHVGGVIWEEAVIALQNYRKAKGGE